MRSPRGIRQAIDSVDFRKCSTGPCAELSDQAVGNGPQEFPAQRLPGIFGSQSVPPSIRPHAEHCGRDDFRPVGRCELAVGAIADSIGHHKREHPRQRPVDRDERILTNRPALPVRFADDAGCDQERILGPADIECDVRVGRGDYFRSRNQSNRGCGLGMPRLACRHVAARRARLRRSRRLLAALGRLAFGSAVRSW